ncbi:tubulin binding cofactor A [Scheffersomyces coipomensis]|uniref:tubulin binding cofactor A n=1 Tax=Scheffersomyces coipomensis TaxID=1788519 RepID=UPI00315D9B02
MSPTQLTIKVNALKRLIKEETLYQQEVNEQESYVESMKSNNGDEYEIKKQVEVLDESKRMITELKKKLVSYTDDLKTFVENYTGDEDLSSAKELLV